ncbi:MAG: SRPBCC family protein [Thermoanaerobaculia bacterium]
MAFAIEQSIHVGAAPETVWRLLADCGTWRLWWPGLVDASTADRKPLRDGSRLRLAVALRGITFNFKSEVSVATPPRILIWVARSLGVTGQHAFYLEARPDGVAVRQIETLQGPGSPLFRLLGFGGATSAMFRANLRGLKRLAERSL